jgi:hypothetical protein
MQGANAPSLRILDDKEEAGNNDAEKNTDDEVPDCPFEMVRRKSS